MTTGRERYLIVNADDFGQSRGVNAGVAAAFERGILTSASLMVRWPAAAGAAAYGRAHPGLSVGLHVDLCEWVHRADQWYPLYEVVGLDDRDAVEREISRQLARFQELVGAEPTHIDSHQHVHESEPTKTVLQGVAAHLGVPLRNSDETVHIGFKVSSQHRVV